MACPEMVPRSTRYALAFDISEPGFLAQHSQCQRISLDPGKTEQGLLKLVLTVVELIRQVLEKQAIRRIDAQDLTSEEVDRLGTTLMELAAKVGELKQQFEIDDLNIDLGPLGRLLEE